ncbi:hypothetical protein EDB85DRAFT_2149023 [Lactarius pseudohatsudake]|nr:hypothetical protein EDB85DRAFT_2149023 [Lactarius pseudohatsudake]
MTPLTRRLIVGGGIFEKDGAMVHLYQTLWAELDRRAEHAIDPQLQEEMYARSGPFSIESRPSPSPRARAASPIIHLPVATLSASTAVSAKPWNPATSAPHEVPLFYVAGGERLLPPRRSGALQSYLFFYPAIYGLYHSPILGLNALSITVIYAYS